MKTSWGSGIFFLQVNARSWVSGIFFLQVNARSYLAVGQVKVLNLSQPISILGPQVRVLDCESSSLYWQRHGNLGSGIDIKNNMKQSK